ncbi:hypothetical protein BFp0046 (plasmid) [Bacteroides fragilis YCH46]|uniref:Uncharacterized protein n=1 Tax=Bacteroides fragilis (strain YCH46) TaxID=295405 RepID=Q64MB4_BACFR|nr:hypothetical protein BFp0046 [Bacteroides fragilis YCH46]
MPMKMFKKILNITIQVFVGLLKIAFFLVFYMAKFFLVFLGIFFLGILFSQRK